MRWTVILLAAIIATTVLLDPYSWWYNASDLVMPGTWYQRTLAAAQLILLAAGVIALWKQPNAVFHWFALETFMALGLAITLVVRDGIGRFIHGFGGEEYASWFLGAVLLRVLLLSLTHSLLLRRARLELTTRLPN